MKNTKKSVSIFIICIGIVSLWSASTQAVYRPGWSYWDNWKQTYTRLTPKTNIQTQQTKTSFRYPYRYNYGYVTRERNLNTRNTWNYSETNRPQKGVFNTRVTEQASRQPTRTVYERLRDRFLQNNQSIQQNQYAVSVSLRDQVQEGGIQDIDRTIHPVLYVGMTNKSRWQSQRFVSALEIQAMEIEMIDTSGIAQNPEDFELVINEEQSYGFDENGRVYLQFQNARLAQNETMSLELGIRVKNPDFTPHENGSFRLRMGDITAKKENTDEEVSVFITGNRLSSYVGFVPISQTSTQKTVRVRPQTIDGRRLSANSKAVVMKANFSAAYDDLLVEEVIVKDMLSNGSIDRFASQIIAKSEYTGEVLGTGRFVNGHARIQFANPIKIYRTGERKSVLFEIHIANRINTPNNKFKLEIDSRDVKVYSASTGRDLSDMHKNIEIVSDIFTVSQSGGNLFISVPENQKGFAVLETSPESVFRFQIVNNDNRGMSLARITLDVQLNGLDFAGGKSTDDFVLDRIYNGRQVSSKMTPSIGSGSRIIFDADQEIFIPGNTTFEYVLKMKLEDVVSGSPKYDTVLVNILNDASLSQGSISQLRSSDVNFIWSDHTRKNPSWGGDNWSSGFLIDGLPSGFTPVYRQ